MDIYLDSGRIVTGAEEIIIIAKDKEYKFTKQDGDRVYLFSGDIISFSIKGGNK